MSVRSNGVLEKIRGYLAAGPTEGLRRFLREVHYADLAEALPELNLAQQIKIIRMCEPSKAAAVLYELDRIEVAALLEGLGEWRAALILKEMSPDDAVDLLGAMPREEQERFLSLMGTSEAEDVQELLEYGPETAGGIMTTEYISVNEDVTAGEALQILRATAPDAETVYYVYVVNKQNQLVGVVSLRELILSLPSTRVADVMRTEVVSVHINTDQEEVARIVGKYDFLAVPVVDDRRELRGIVTFDDILDVVQEEATEDILRLATVEYEGRYFETGIFRRAIRRLPWLVALLFGELLAGRVIENFSLTLKTATALAFFMTVMAGGPGNLATQTLTVIVRGLATGEVNPGAVLSVIFQEIRVAVIIALVSGLVLAFIAYVWQGQVILGLIVGVSLAFSMVAAAVVGRFMPLIINRFGVDPALASGPFIATLMDVCSMLIYFGLATFVLHHLLA
ncbi:MAG: magnesium transporter [Firmicutes bacterium]|nr:magnesium transporter [Bacillota bacterium]